MVKLRRSTGRGEYSRSLGQVGRFVLSHKALVAGVWVAVAVVLAVLFPQLETVVRQQSVDPILRACRRFRRSIAWARRSTKKGAKTTVFVAMEDPAGLTEPARQRYDDLVVRLRADRDDVQAVRDLLADPITARQALSEDGKSLVLARRGQRQPRRADGGPRCGIDPRDRSRGRVPAPARQST